MWDSIHKLEEIYQELLDSPIGILSSTKELMEFLELPASKEDLICFRDVCAKNELYEWALIVQRKIN